MPFQKFELVNKIQLTADIFELTYKYEKNLDEMIPWQFVTFILPDIWWRAYSILERDIEKKQAKLIIKKWTKEMHGRWWSIMLCDALIWDIFKWVWPAGHFKLNPIHNNKLFLWTWTGFVPLYNQIVATLESWNKENITFLFWVRETKWLFYIDKLKALKEKYPNFNFEVYISREKSVSYNKWYITDFLTKETTELFEEYYICWAPHMIESSISILKWFWVNEGNVFYEKY